MGTSTGLSLSQLPGHKHSRLQQLARLIRVLWFQYEISFAAYCFDWWEKLIVLAVLLSVLFLVSYGVYRQCAALYYRLGALPWLSLVSNGFHPSE